MILFHQTSFHFLGNWGPWTVFSACSETCQSDPNVTPTRRRTRICVGSTLEGFCEPLIVNGVSYNDTWIEECNVNKSCQGMWIICETKKAKKKKKKKKKNLFYSHVFSTLSSSGRINGPKKIFCTQRSRRHSNIKNPQSIFIYRSVFFVSLRFLGLKMKANSQKSFHSPKLNDP